MDAKMLRIAFMGTPDFAVASLCRLVELGYNIVAVVTAPDRAAGRGLKVQQSAVKRYAVEQGLRIMQPEKLRDPEFLEEFKSLKVDLAIVIAFRMLPELLWAQPRLGTFNLHASLLPQYRGAAPINWAVINGERTTGVTTFMLNHEIDKGAIIAQRELEIGERESAGELHDRLMMLGRELVVETVDKIASGGVVPIEQNATDEEFKGAPKIFRENCRVDWAQTPDRIDSFIRGLSPYPAAWSQMEMDGQRVDVRLFAADPEVDANSKTPTGEIESDGKTEMKIRCKGGYIVIRELQVAGKRRMSVEEYLRGIGELPKRFI